MRRLWVSLVMMGDEWPGVSGTMSPGLPRFVLLSPGERVVPLLWLGRRVHVGT